MPKLFMTYEQQIHKLRDKNLTITDEEEAKSILQRDGYYALITGYKDLFKNPSTKDYRDGCAHNERMFSHRCAKKDIPDFPLHKKLVIQTRGNYYLCGKRDYFAVVLAFRYLLPNAEFLRYKSQLSKLIDKAVTSNQQISHNKLLNIMGFPQNWKKVTSYRKV